MKYTADVEGQSYTVEVSPDGTVLLNGQPHVVDLAPVGDGGLFSLLLDSTSYEALVEEREGMLHVLLRGRLYPVQVQDERTRRLARARVSLAPATGEVPIKAPIPGLVVDVPVQAGQEVRQGDVLVILESMKMQNELKAPRDGMVMRVNVKSGDSVEGNQTLVVVA